MASLNSAQSSVQKVESLTHRRVTIETELNEANLSKCHHQEQSQLFTLPLEIRDFIWHYATEPYDDPKFTFDPRADYHPVTFSPAGAFYDLSYKADQLSCVSLLQTCRRVWLETNRLPLEKAKLSCAVLSGGDLMKPLRRDAKGEFIPIEDFLLSLTPNNLQNLAHITMVVPHWSIQMLCQSRGVRTGCEKLQGMLGPCPRIVTMSARSTPSYSGSEPSASDWKAWVAMLLNFPASPRLQEMRVEFEVTEWTSGLRDDVMGWIRETKGIMQRMDMFGHPVTMRLDDEAREAKWQCTVNGTQMERRLVTLTWRVISTPEDGCTRSKKHSTGLTHDCGSSLPLLAVDPFGDVKQKSASGFEEERLVAQHQQKWETEGSLLKFVAGVHA